MVVQQKMDILYDHHLLHIIGSGNIFFSHFLYYYWKKIKCEKKKANTGNSPYIIPFQNDDSGAQCIIQHYFFLLFLFCFIFVVVVKMVNFASQNVERMEQDKVLTLEKLWKKSFIFIINGFWNEKIRTKIYALMWLLLLLLLLISYIYFSLYCNLLSLSISF